MSRNVVVTGGAGFIGSHVVDAMLAEGCEVAVIDDLSTGRRENVDPRARFYEVDIRDAQAVRAVFEAERPEVVFHQAAQADVRASLVDPAGYAETNIIGTLNLLQAAVALAQGTGAADSSAGGPGAADSSASERGAADSFAGGPGAALGAADSSASERGAGQSGARGTMPRFVFASTGGAVYGNPAELPATERCPTLPLDPYGTSKLACEYYLYTYKHNYGLSYVVLRYANVYGPRQNADGEAGVVAIFAKAMLEGRPVTINGDGRQTRDFVYVGDVAAANVAASRYGSGIYNVGTGMPADIDTIGRELAKIIGYTQEIKHGPAKLGEVRHTYLDSRKAGLELGWEAAVELKEGLRRTVEWFVTQVPGTSLAIQVPGTFKVPGT